MFSENLQKPSTVSGSGFVDLALRKVWNHRTHRSRMSPTSLRSISSSFLMYAELCLASLLSSSSSSAFRGRLDRLPERVFRVCGRRLGRSSVRQPCETSEDCQPSSRSFEDCCCGVLRVGASSPLLCVVMLRSSHPPLQDPRTNPVLRAGT